MFFFTVARLGVARCAGFSTHCRRIRSTYAVTGFGGAGRHSATAPRAFLISRPNSSRPRRTETQRGPSTVRAGAPAAPAATGGMSGAAKGSLFGLALAVMAAAAIALAYKSRFQYDPDDPLNQLAAAAMKAGDDKWPTYGEQFSAGRDSAASPRSDSSGRLGYAAVVARPRTVTDRIRAAMREARCCGRRAGKGAPPPSSPRSPAPVTASTPLLGGSACRRPSPRPVVANSPKVAGAGVSSPTLVHGDVAPYATSASPSAPARQSQQQPPSPPAVGALPPSADVSPAAVVRPPPTPRGKTTTSAAVATTSFVAGESTAPPPTTPRSLKF